MNFNATTKIAKQSRGKKLDGQSWFGMNRPRIIKQVRLEYVRSLPLILF